MTNRLTDEEIAEIERRAEQRMAPYGGKRVTWEDFTFDRLISDLKAAREALMEAHRHITVCDHNSRAVTACHKAISSYLFPEDQTNV